MKIERFRRPLLALFVGALLGAGLTACSDSPTEEEDHPVGLVMVNAAGQDAARIVEGPTTTGQLTVPANGSATYTLFALLESGAREQIDGTELEVRIATQPTNSTLTVQGNRLTVAGRAAGSGSARIELLHEGHAELGNLVPVVVQ